MTLKRDDNTQKEYEGILFLNSLINNDNSIFIKTDTGDDLGIDGYIELTNNGYVTGFLMAVQIKSGTVSVVRQGGSFYAKTTKKHLEYWSKCNIPVVIIAYSTRSEEHTSELQSRGH